MYNNQRYDYIGIQKLIWYVQGIVRDIHMETTDTSYSSMTFPYQLSQGIMNVCQRKLKRK